MTPFEIHFVKCVKMDYAHLAQTWERLAVDNDATAQILLMPSGDETLDYQNALAAHAEKLGARECRMRARELRELARH